MPGKVHDKRSVAWDLDPAILARLEIVARMMSEGKYLFTIAAALGVSMATINRDAARVRELWRRASLKDIDDKRAESLAQYRRAQKKAWEHLVEAERKGNGVVSLLRLITEIEDKIAKLEGTLVSHVDVTTQGESIKGDAREVSDADLAAVLAAQNRPQR